jgi:hypothetical protein
MFKTLAAAVVAASLIAGPALAQTPASTGPAPVTTSQPAAKADAVKPGVKMVKNTRHHTVKIVKHVTHVKHARHFKHFNHLKQVVKHPAKAKTAG